MNRGTVSVSKYDADEFSFILRDMNVPYDTFTQNDTVDFYIDADEEKIEWFKKLAYEINVGFIKVSAPSVKNYNDFMNALDHYDLTIAGTKYTWIFGHQYLIKGHQANLAAFHTYLKSYKK